MYELIYQNNNLSFTLNTDTNLYEATVIIDKQFINDIYTIIWDGLKYVEYNSGGQYVSLGNYDYQGNNLDENLGGEPFYFSHIPGSSNEFKFITNTDSLTHAIEIYQDQYLPISCLMYQNQICFGKVNSLDEGPTCRNTSRPILNLQENEQYTVVWNDVPYICTASLQELRLSDTVVMLAMCLGNIKLNEGFNSKNDFYEPFLYFEILGQINENGEITYINSPNLNQQFNISSDTDNIYQNFTVSIYKGIYSRDKHWIAKDIEASFTYNEEMLGYTSTMMTINNGETWMNEKQEVITDTPILIETLIPDEKYTVIWDNKKYACTAIDAGDGMTACGNLWYNQGQGYATGEPFVLGTRHSIQGSSDSFVCIAGTPDPSSTHTISIYKGEHKAIFENAYLDNNFMADMAPGGNCVVLFGDHSMKLGAQYTIVVDDETYTLEAFGGQFAGFDVVGVGNPAAIGVGSDNGIPFGFGSLSQDGMTMFMLMMVDPDARTEQHIASLYEGPAPIGTMKVNAVVNDKNGNPKVYENVKTLSVNTDDNKIATFVLESIKEE